MEARKAKPKPKPKPKPPHSIDQEMSALVNGIVEATARTNAASRAFIETIGHYPGLAPGGAKHIRNASHELSAARQEMMKAHKRLHDFLTRGLAR